MGVKLHFVHKNTVFSFLIHSVGWLTHLSNEILCWLFFHLQGQADKGEKENKDGENEDEDENAEDEESEEDFGDDDYNQVPL